MPRIALIHALAHSVAPVNQAFERDWPEARRMNLLDDSLSGDLAGSAHGLDAAMHQRFVQLADYAVGTGADAILFTCSAFGPCIEAVARRHAAVPVLKPNEAMVARAVASGRRVGLVASFAPTLLTMPPEFPHDAQPDCELAVGAMQALDCGDVQAHDRAAADAAVRLVRRGCAVIALAQFSLARAAPAVHRATGVPVLTTIDTALAELRRRLQQAASG
jgi:aspartate/glutamate racemase